jgi:CheY-like chemotaxis protein
MTGEVFAKTILIADDNAAQRRFLELLLTMDGHSVKVVEDGLEALEVIQTETLALVISDIHMPYMTGIELCQEIKEIKPTLPVVLLTSMEDEATEKLARAAKVDAFFRKPVVGKDFRKLVGHFLKDIPS